MLHHPPTRSAPRIHRFGTSLNSGEDSAAHGDQPQTMAPHASANAPATRAPALNMKAAPKNRRSREPQSNSPSKRRWLSKPWPPQQFSENNLSQMHRFPPLPDFSTLMDPMDAAQPQRPFLFGLEEQGAHQPSAGLTGMPYAYSQPPGLGNPNQSPLPPQWDPTVPFAETPRQAVIDHGSAFENVQTVQTVPAMGEQDHAEIRWGQLKQMPFIVCPPYFPEVSLTMALSLDIRDSFINLSLPIQLGLQLRPLRIMKTIRLPYPLPGITTSSREILITKYVEVKFRCFKLGINRNITANLYVLPDDCIEFDMILGGDIIGEHGLGERMQEYKRARSGILPEILPTFRPVSTLPDLSLSSLVSTSETLASASSGITPYEDFGVDGNKPMTPQFRSPGTPQSGSMAPPPPPPPPHWLNFYTQN